MDIIKPSFLLNWGLEKKLKAIYIHYFVKSSIVSLLGYFDYISKTNKFKS